MKRNNVYADIHVIQTVPPSNINRDDTGSPKTAQYGGVTRARVSSQAWKKAVREFFKEQVENGNMVGKRSLQIVQYLAEEIRRQDSSLSVEESVERANDVLNKAGVKTNDKKVKALFFISDQQTKNLAKAAIEGKTDKKELQNILNANPSVDIALFGRMVADDPSLNEDASAQVAHAISTHAVQTEFDFFTAIDDLSPEDTSGAGMLGTVEFNSSTLYRYANVGAHELLRQLDNKDATVEALALFVEGFIKSMPTGKVNTFANQTLPQAVVITLRSDRPVNLVSAFENPVKARDGFVDKSIEQFEKEYKRVQKFVEKPICTLTIGTEGIGEDQESLTNLLEQFKRNLAAALQ